MDLPGVMVTFEPSRRGESVAMVYLPRGKVVEEFKAEALTEFTRLAARSHHGVEIMPSLDPADYVLTLASVGEYRMELRRSA